MERRAGRYAEAPRQPARLKQGYTSVAHDHRHRPFGRLRPVGIAKGYEMQGGIRWQTGRACC